MAGGLAGGVRDEDAGGAGAGEAAARVAERVLQPWADAGGSRAAGMESALEADAGWDLPARLGGVSLGAPTGAEGCGEEALWCAALPRARAHQAGGSLVAYACSRSAACRGDAQG